MKFIPTEVEGAFVLHLERHEDDRGFFARSFCATEFKAHGLALDVVQSNVAFTRQKGTLRGLHYQIPPSHEAKLICCTRGAVYDVIVDLRPDSPTFRKHCVIELSAANGHALYVPSMCGHGYQTLMDESEVAYLVSDFYDPACERGLRYNDPSLRIQWPLPVSTISDKDRSWPLLEDRHSGTGQ